MFTLDVFRRRLNLKNSMILPRKAPLTAPSTATLGLEVGGVKGGHSIPAAVSSMYPVEDWSEDRQVLPQM